jgi:methylenetetrahydrofolate reductase (NADPH)
MKITDIINNGEKRLSFEVFPPKSGSSFESVRLATEEIASLSPSFMSVTYGAGGGTSKYTLEIARNIREKYSVPSLAHLTCVSSTRKTVAERISDMKMAGIKNVMALRGDIPKDMEGCPRDYKYAYQLVEELRHADADFCIGGACYPEGHPESGSKEIDLMNLRHKVDFGLDFLTTQMFFDNHLFYDFMSRAVGVGIGLPVLPGIMPITSVMQVDRVVALSGCYLPREFLSMVDKFSADPVAMKQAGIDYATRQIHDLMAQGVKNIHVYSMNKPDVARAILNNCR